MEMAERPPYVQFETRPIEDREASLKEGHYVARNVDYALITPPGSKDCVERIALEWLEQIKKQAAQGKYPQTWERHFQSAYAAWKENNEIPEHGMPIKGWQLLSPAQQEQIVRANVKTVEDLACLNEAGLGRIGMGARDLQNKAKAWLQTAHDSGKVAAENAALKAEIDTLKEQLAELQTRVIAQNDKRKKAANE